MLTGRKSAERRPHYLLFDTCRCGHGRSGVCLACLRWARHYAAVQERRRAWRAAR